MERISSAGARPSRLAPGGRYSRGAGRGSTTSPPHSEREDAYQSKPYCQRTGGRDDRVLRHHPETDGLSLVSGRALNTSSTMTSPWALGAAIPFSAPGATASAARFRRTRCSSTAAASDTTTPLGRVVRLPTIDLLRRTRRPARLETLKPPLEERVVSPMVRQRVRPLMPQQQRSFRGREYLPADLGPIPRRLFVVGPEVRLTAAATVTPAPAKPCFDRILRQTGVSPASRGVPAHKAPSVSSARCPRRRSPYPWAPGWVINV